MDFREWVEAVGVSHLGHLAEETGVSIGHIVHIRNGSRLPGSHLALKIIDYARRNTPGVVPDLEELLKGTQ
jgi:hypothetical protein